ncbi:superinfection immunity protein [Granulicella arctica]|uniref:Mg2+ and Co2+ transporter CorA n=1 Tax=Granulicella arctica TaxID=940613 RepID=A0A7Y9PKK5_9BACT|nr:superinfection immunity protein [Granulicella arctica]NYF80826.1 Mg2+ and Co2+ transporter CorA [Granulicella arctica]
MITLSILTLMYFLPTIVAANRGHGVTGILLLNLLFGWTGIGWFALMLWAILSAPHYILVPAPCYAPYAGYRR